MSDRAEVSFTLPYKLRVDGGRRRQHVELGAQPVKEKLGKRLHENICELISTRDEGHLQAFGGDLFVNKMEVNFDVFGASMEDGVSCEISITKIVTIVCESSVQRDVELVEDRSVPKELCSGIYEGFILSFSTRLSNAWLLLGAPRD